MGNVGNLGRSTSLSIQIQKKLRYLLRHQACVANAIFHGYCAYPAFCSSDKEHVTFKKTLKNQIKFKYE